MKKEQRKQEPFVHILWVLEWNPLNNREETKRWNAVDCLAFNSFPTLSLFSSVMRLSESSEQSSRTRIKKKLINVTKFQIVRSQTEWKHTDWLLCNENYSHFPEWSPEKQHFLHKKGSRLFLKMTWSSKNWPSSLDKQLKWNDFKHFMHLIHCLLLSFTITSYLFNTANW